MHVRTFVEVGSRYEELIGQAAEEPIDQPVAAEDMCIIMYTSAPTAAKGAMLTHGNLTWNAVNVLVDHDLTADERALVSRPVYHTAGLNMLTLPVLLKGGTCVLVESFDPAATLDLIERHRITFMFGTDHVRPGGPASPVGRRRPVLAAHPHLRRLAHYRPRSSPPTRSAGSPSCRATA